MKSITRTFTEIGNYLFPLDHYSSKTAVNVTTGTATIQTSISDFNSEVTPVAFETVTLPGKIDYPISGLLVNISISPATVEVLQADNC